MGNTGTCMFSTSELLETTGVSSVGTPSPASSPTDSMFSAASVAGGGASEPLLVTGMVATRESVILKSRGYFPKNNEVLRQGEPYYLKSNNVCTNSNSRL